MLEFCRSKNIVTEEGKENNTAAPNMNSTPPVIQYTIPSNKWGAVHVPLCLFLSISGPEDLFRSGVDHIVILPLPGLELHFKYAVLVIDIHIMDL